MGSRANEKGAGLKLVLPPEGWAAVGYPTAILAHAPHPNAAKIFMDFLHSEPFQNLDLNFGGVVVGRLGLKSRFEFYPKPIYDLQGPIPMEWSKFTSGDRLAAREEFRKLVMGGD
jgi:ABC-type Fe3+ transport system substrate-binding protein